MNDLLTTLASEVTEDQVDHLGHMNVRYYAENASAGAGPRVAHAAAVRRRANDLAGSDLVASSPSLDEVRARGLAMRRARLVTAEECDAAGRYAPEMAPMLVWGGEPVRRDAGPWLEEMPGGELMEWASMETRIQTRRLPLVGERVQSFAPSRPSPAASGRPARRRPRPEPAEHVVSGPQVVARVHAPLLAAEPLAVHQVDAGDVDGDATAPQPLDRLPVERVRVRTIAHQGAGAHLHAERPVRAARLCPLRPR